MVTVWYFVVLLLTSGGYVSLDPANLPMELPTQQACGDEATSRMIDRRNPNIALFCVEADDYDDMVKILNDNFDFGPGK